VNALRWAAVVVGGLVMAACLLLFVLWVWTQA
jgi:hypothetical protein